MYYLSPKKIFFYVITFFIFMSCCLVLQFLTGKEVLFWQIILLYIFGFISTMNATFLIENKHNGKIKIIVKQIYLILLFNIFLLTTVIFLFPNPLYFLITLIINVFSVNLFLRKVYLS